MSVDPKAQVIPVLTSREEYLEQAEAIYVQFNRMARVSMVLNELAGTAEQVHAVRQFCRRFSAALTELETELRKGLQ